MADPESTQPPDHLRLFQSALSRQLRAGTDANTDIANPALTLYRELLFNNVCGFIDRCFPVTAEVLPPDVWRRLREHFFRHAKCETPYFRDIPAEFLAFVQDQSEPGLPSWLSELMHYEWIELMVESHPARVPDGIDEQIHELADDLPIRVNPTLQNLQYQWPVHTIAPDSLPQMSAPCFLLVYRTCAHQVRFLEANPMAAVLLQLIEMEPRTILSLTAAMSKLWTEVDQPRLKRLIQDAVAGLATNEAVFTAASPDVHQEDSAGRKRA